MNESNTRPTRAAILACVAVGYVVLLVATIRHEAGNPVALGYLLGLVSLTGTAFVTARWAIRRYAHRPITFGVRTGNRTPSA